MIKLFSIVGILLLATGFIVVHQMSSEVVTQDLSPINDTRVSITDTAADLEVKEETMLVKNDNTVDLSNRGLTEVPTSVFTNTAVTVLDLSHNRLSGSLPAEIRQLQNLRILNLSNNQFTGVPAEIGQLEKLEILDLSNNNLTGLPYELGNLTNLQQLILRGNQYSSADLTIITQNLPAGTRVITN